MKPEKTLPIRTIAELQAKAREIIAAAVLDGEAGRLDTAIYRGLKAGLSARGAGTAASVPVRTADDAT